jgi:enamine deaminase RidA (YjgF/YER057c/UK114 family)
MSITRIGPVTRPSAPRIHLGAACPQMISVCLTAPDKGGDIVEQTLGILTVIEGHLKDRGCDRRALAMVQVWLAGIDDHAAFNAVWNEWIDDGHVPALSVVEAAASRRDSLIEIRAYAVSG